jgi:hypothetical protein
MGEQDNLVQHGRIKIKNRAKNFTVTVSKSAAVEKLAVKVLVGIDDMSFKNASEYQLIKENRIQIQVPIDAPNNARYVYFRFIQDEDEEVAAIPEHISAARAAAGKAIVPVIDRSGKPEQPRYLKVFINFGINNFNKYIANQLVQKAKLARSQGEAGNYGLGGQAQPTDKKQRGSGQQAGSGNVQHAQ